jgi:hypothetical protein
MDGIKTLKVNEAHSTEELTYVTNTIILELQKLEEKIKKYDTGNFDKIKKAR